MEYFVEHIIALNMQDNKEKAFKEFMDKMCVAEKSVECNGCYSEEEVEELAKI